MTNFIVDVLEYCESINIEVDYFSNISNVIDICGDITLDQIGGIYEYFKDEYQDIVIQFRNDMQYMFRIYNDKL